MPTEKDIKEYSKACTAMVVAQQLLIKNQMELQQQEDRRLDTIILMNRLYYKITTDPSVLPQYFKCIDLIDARNRDIGLLYAKQPKLITALHNARNRFAQASRAMQ